MKFIKLLKDIPDYAENLRGAKSAMDDTKDLWNGGNVLAGRREGKQTVFKKPYSIFATAIAFNLAYVMLILGTLQKWIEVSLTTIGESFIYLVRFIFAVLIVALSSPIFLVALAIDMKTGENTKFGNKITVLENDEKNSDKA